jgi:hypothetical protein
MLAYADVCWRMLTYADVFSQQSCTEPSRRRPISWRMLTYADVCWRMLT